MDIIAIVFFLYHYSYSHRYIWCYCSSLGLLVVFCGVVLCYQKFVGTFSNFKTKNSIHISWFWDRRGVETEIETVAEVIMQSNGSMFGLILLCSYMHFGNLLKKFRFSLDWFCNYCSFIDTCYTLFLMESRTPSIRPSSTVGKWTFYVSNYGGKNSQSVIIKLWLYYLDTELPKF